MANLASVLKDEIGRLASKEIRQQMAGTARTVSRCERDIAALKRQIEDLQRKLSSRTRGTPQQTGGTKTSGKKAATKKQAAQPASDSDRKSSRTRFSAKGLKTNRERLGLSADNYGKLIGVSGLSIYNWEQEKARPRESNIAALMTIRRIGKREAAKRLEELATPPPKAETTVKADANREAEDSKAAGEGDDGQAKAES